MHLYIYSAGTETEVVLLNLAWINNKQISVGTVKPSFEFSSIFSSYIYISLALVRPTRHSAPIPFYLNPKRKWPYKEHRILTFPTILSLLAVATEMPLLHNRNTLDHCAFTWLSVERKPKKFESFPSCNISRLTPCVREFFDQYWRPSAIATISPRSRSTGYALFSLLRTKKEVFSTIYTTRTSFIHLSQALVQLKNRL